MSYFYSVNRDNPLGYFSIDFNYRYLDFDSYLPNTTTPVYQKTANPFVYYPYGGTIDPSGPYPSFSPYIQLSSYTAINQLKVSDQSYFNNLPAVFGLSYSSPIVSGNTNAAQISSNSSVEITNLYDAFDPSSENDTFSIEFWLSMDWMDGQALDLTEYNSFTTNSNRGDIGFRFSVSSYPQIHIMDIGYYSTTASAYYGDYPFIQIGSIVYNQQKNSIEFFLFDKDNKYVKSYALVKDLDSPMHVYVSYSNKTMNVIVNGETGISAQINGLYSDVNKPLNPQSLKFKIQGTVYDNLTSMYVNRQSKSLSNGQYFLISNLAFYNYILNQKQINNHIKWALYDNKPALSSVQANTKMFLLEETQNNFQYKKTFNGKDFNQYTKLSNLTVTPEGLGFIDAGVVSLNTLNQSSIPLFSPGLQPPLASYAGTIQIDGIYGMCWNGNYASLDYNKFGSISSVPCTIGLIVSNTTPSWTGPYYGGATTQAAYSDEYIWSINGVNGNSTLFVERYSGNYRLCYYDVVNGGGTPTVLATVTPNNTGTYLHHKIAVSLTSSSATLTVISASTDKYYSSSDIVDQASSSAYNFAFSYNSILSIGQSYWNGNSLTSSGLRKNCSVFSFLSITDAYITDFTTYDQYINGYHYGQGFPWAGLTKYGVTFEPIYTQYNNFQQTNTFPVCQMGSWMGTIPLTSLSDLIGSKIDWNSTNNCLVEYTYPNWDPNPYHSGHSELQWYVLPRRGSHIPGIDFAKELSNLLIRVTMIANYQVQDLNQTFNNLQIGFYRNMNFYSDDGSYSLLPNTSSTYTSLPCTIKGHSKSIQSRSNNLGILFPSETGYNVSGYAKIANTNANSLAGVDFWFRPDTNYKNSVILTASSTTSGYPHLYINSQGTLAWNSNISQVYVNGALISNAISASTSDDYTSQYTMNQYNPVHMVVKFTNTYTGDLYINGYKETQSGISQQFDNASYGSVSYSSGTNTFTTPTYASATAQQSSSGYFAVTPGRTYIISANVSEGYIQSTGTTRSANIYITWYRSDGSVINAYGPSSVTLSTTPTNISYTVVAQTGAAFGQIGFSFSGTHVYETYGIQGLSVNDSVAGNLVIHKIGDSTGSVTSNCTASYNSASDTTTVSIGNAFNPNTYSQSSTSHRFTILRRTMHTASINLRSAANYTTNSGQRSAYLVLNWIDASGNILSSQSGNTDASLSTTTSTASVSSFPPDNAVYGNFSVILYYGDVSETYYASGITLSTLPSGSESSFGYINLWENTLFSTDAANRYNLFTTNAVALYSNDNYENDTSNLLDFDSAKDRLAVHKIGN